MAESTPLAYTANVLTGNLFYPTAFAASKQREAAQDKNKADNGQV